MNDNAPLSVTFYLQPDDRARFVALHAATRGLDAEDELAEGLLREGLVEEDGSDVTITTAGRREMLRLMQVSKEAFEQRRGEAGLRRSSSSAGEPANGRSTGAGQTGPVNQGVRSASPAKRKHVSQAPSYPTHQEST